MTTELIIQLLYNGNYISKNEHQEILRRHKTNNYGIVISIDGNRYIINGNDKISVNNGNHPRGSRWMEISKSDPECIVRIGEFLKQND